MTLGRDASKILINPWASIKWTIAGAPTDLGFTGKPIVEIEPQYVAKLTSQTGAIELGHSFSGAACNIVTPLLQPDEELIRAMVPWAEADGSFRLLPQALGADLYDYAAELRLHPLSAADEDDLSKDLVLRKAVPTGALKLNRDGNEHDILAVSWKVYPDRDELPALEFGWLGETYPA